MRILVRVCAALVLAVASFGVGAWWTHRAAATSPRQTAAYACPMHPQYRSDHPGDCPSCGMRLELVRSADTGDALRTTDRLGPDGGPLPDGTVRVSPERQQAVGVRLGVAEQVAGTRSLRTTGRVAANENATFPLVAGISGWIRHVGNATTGMRVRKNEVLASFYAPEFITALQSYYSGLDTAGRVSIEPNQQLRAFNQNRVADGVQRFADTLRNMGVSEKQLDEMTRNRRLVQDIELVSPIDGFVLQRNISAGLRFDRGFEFYRIADLSRVWILADVYQHQLPFIRAGMTARAATAQASRPFQATVSRAEPIFDEATLTLKVRLETENRGYVLKPGMFVDVELPIELPAGLVVPADAIVDSGMRKTVFVDRGGGYFEPRQVETGWRVADSVEVTKGLMAGERIVISGTFLIDSESRMKTAARDLGGAVSEDVVCGMQVDEKGATAAGRRLERGGKTYFFCSDECKHKFERDAARYLDRRPPPASPPPRKVQASAENAGAMESHAPRSATAPEPPVLARAAAAPARNATEKDPICGMDVAVDEAVAAGRVSRRDGRLYYFCSDLCKKQFDAALPGPAERTTMPADATP